jgi:hypothetical protein
MYSAAQGLPFIVFHYPPLFYLVTRAVACFTPDLLFAGRLVSAISAVAIAPLIAGLVLVAVRSSNRAHPAMQVGIAIAAGVLALGLHAVRTIGVLLSDLVGKLHFSLVTCLLILGVLVLPFRQLPDHFPQADIDLQAALVQRIAQAAKPVASENMTLLMRAGKPVVFEPAIVTELASLGRWDEGPLVRMIRSGGFAFMITTDNFPGATFRRSPAVNAAMLCAYPRVEKVGPGLWLHLPPE